MTVYFTAPGSDKFFKFSGFVGWVNWAASHFTERNRYTFVNDMRLGLWMFQPIKQTPEDLKLESQWWREGQHRYGRSANGTPYKVNKNRFMSVLGIPCQKPPFGNYDCD